MDEGSLPEAFRSPPADYGPAPLLVFNDEHEGEAGEGRITRVLEGHERVGYGGVFLHPRPGLMTEYLSARWFELMRHAVKECLRLGLVPYLYDENSYPSGFAGGHVPARVPEARSRYVGVVFGEGPDGVPEDRLSLHSWDGDRPGRVVKKGEIDSGWVAFVMGSMQPLAWHGETVYPSLLDPRTAEAFLETTYEAYRMELGDLWGEIPAVFTDEPHLPAEGHGPWSPAYTLPLTCLDSSGSARATTCGPAWRASSTTLVITGGCASISTTLCMSSGSRTGPGRWKRGARRGMWPSRDTTWSTTGRVLMRRRGTYTCWPTCTGQGRICWRPSSSRDTTSTTYRTSTRARTAGNLTA